MASAAVVFAYIAVYCVNSAAGGYPRVEWRYPNGGVIWNVISEPYVFRWEPYLGRWSENRRDILGYLFAPLIELDRRCVHRSRHREEADFEYWYENSYPRLKHPVFRFETPM